MMSRPPADNWNYFLFATAITALLMLNFGWFREQFCVIMCPYGRFQSVLMDQNTVAVMYDEKRGEPRRSLAATKSGDCISCNSCVQVCPTKIDIRDGIQMECISCTACVDACNEMMRKVKKPEGLIGHRRISGEKSSVVSVRVIAYAFLSFLVLAGLIYSLSTRKAYSMVIVRATDAPYQVLQDGRILNHFKSHYLNQSTQRQAVELHLSAEDILKGFQMTQSEGLHILEPGDSIEPHLFISFPKALLGPSGEVLFKIIVVNKYSGVETSADVKGMGPYSGGS